MTPSRPLISIVIPCYNAAAFIVATLHSVQAQTCTDWEALIVDDGSSDASPGIVADMARHDSRLRLLRCAHQGVSAARNLGVQQSRGDYIALLDADDLWEVDKLAAHLSHLHAHPQVGVSFSRAAFMDVHGRLTGVVSSAPIHGLEIRHFLYENPATTTSSLVARRAVFSEAGGFDEAMSYAEDLEWLVRVQALTGWQIDGIEQPLTRYRCNDAGLSARLDQMQSGWERMMMKLHELAPEVVSEHYALAKATHLRYLARRSVRIKAHPQQGYRYMQASLSANWRILLHQPVRTLATLSAVFARLALQRLGSPGSHA
jgi:glycosyltransferase involved in cell wall biosynthesis